MGGDVFSTSALQWQSIQISRDLFPASTDQFKIYILSIRSDPKTDQTYDKYLLLTLKDNKKTKDSGSKTVREGNNEPSGY